MGNAERKSKGLFWAWGRGDQFRPADVVNVRRFSALLIAWTLSFAVATVILGKHLVVSAASAIVLATVPTLLGIATVRAYVRFLREADELLRKIHVEAMAWGFGAGAVFMLGYRLFERIGAPKLDVSDAFIVMMLATAVGQYVARRRYL